MPDTRKSIKQRIAALERERATLEAQLRRAQDDPPEPADDPAGVVIWFTKSYHGYDYIYAAVKANGLWYVSGRDRHTNGIMWDALLAFAEDADIWQATTWEKLQ